MHRIPRISVAFATLALLVSCSGCSTQSSALPWHRIELKEEFTAEDVTDQYSWQDYLAQEERVFKELAEKLAAEDTTNGYRYAPNSQFNPLLQTPNWNRTFVLTPKEIRAGIVMLHGLSDSPYSVRALALALEQQGFLVIGLRVPGHGTIPSALLEAKWQDWVAATRLAALEVKRQLGDNPNFYMLGYSNGGALTLNYALDALEDKSLPLPKKMVLLSPMIGISKFAGLSKGMELVGQLPLMSSNLWLNKTPEYNPFKYNSFSVNAGWQAHRFSRQLQAKIAATAKKGQLQNLPAVLTFQSLVDATVKTDAIEYYFYRHLPQNNSELVIFDINRSNNFLPITNSDAANYMHDTLTGQSHPYHLVKIANSNPSTMSVSEWRQPAGAMTQEERPLNLAFPPGVFSLSHVALPFPADDPVNGLDPKLDEFYGIRLGNVQLRGETGTVIISANAGMRLYSNPFYPYMEKRIFEWFDVAR
ncbi:MAG TPA: alpha/beta fold hydrolase [Cellvibrio sp.]|nr:alpha/beta fold hydrolase [Cellvibrio sp.]